MITMATFTPSKYQQDIFNFVRNGRGNAVITAVAGSGKSTTLKQLLNYLPTSANVLYVAFNADAAKELKNKLEQETTRKLTAGEQVCRWDCRTIHSLGNATLKSNGLNCTVKNNKYIALCRQFLKTDLDPNLYDPNYATHLAKLIDMVRLTLSPTDEIGLKALIERFEIDLDVNDKEVWPVMVSAVPAILSGGIQQAQEEKVIDFTDMIWLPSSRALNLSPRKFDWVLVDEAQDLSPAQRELVLNARSISGRFIAVGDRNQAIYGFAGASLRSIDEIVADAGAIELPLSICYRCPRKVIAEANQIRPGTEPAPDAPEGVVDHVEKDKVEDMVEAGDLILCRLTAPLVEMCLSLLRSGKRANVRGKDLGTTFIALIEKIQKQFSRNFPTEASQFLQLADLAHEYQRRQISILSNNLEENEMKIDSLCDKIDTLLALYDAYRAQNNSGSTMSGFIAYITEFFREDQDAQIILSTGHRAKGLEFGRVFILQSDKLPHPKAKTPEQMTQEYNLMYVMYTRAMRALYLVVSRLPKVEEPEQPALPEPVYPIIEVLRASEAARIASEIAVPAPLQDVYSVTDAAAIVEEVLAEQAETRAQVDIWEAFHLTQQAVTSNETAEETVHTIGRPRVKEKLVSFKFPTDVIAFLDSLPKGQKTAFIETLIQASPEFATWKESIDKLSDIR